jgi:hypothetical protein
LKYRLTKYYSLIAFYSLNILLLIVSGVSLDFRFGYPTSFAAYILGVLGIKILFIESRTSIGLIRISNKIILFILLSIGVILTVGYNL